MHEQEIKYSVYLHTCAGVEAVVLRLWSTSASTDTLFAETASLMIWFISPVLKIMFIITNNAWGSVCMYMYILHVCMYVGMIMYVCVYVHVCMYICTYG